MAKILITGSNGQLGSELQDIAKRNKQHEYIFVDVDDLDITEANACLLYTSDAADERSSVDLGGRRIIKKKN